MTDILAIYAFSGDPITNGHINIVERAARVFPRVIVAVGSNPKKKYLFTLDERVRLATHALLHLPDVTVEGFKGMLADYAFQQGAQVLIRGVRNSTDFDYEQMLSSVTESQRLGLETHFLFGDPELLHISSSAVKAIQVEHGSLRGYVPIAVKAALEQRVSNQTIVGVTGSIAAGKTTVCNRLTESFPGVYHHIDLDVLVHELLGSSLAPYAVAMRRRLIDHFGDDLEATGGFIHRHVLAEHAFGRADMRYFINRVMTPAIMVRLRQELYGRTGVILINGALLAETEILDLCNNHVVLVEIDRTTQLLRLKLRQNDDAEARIAAQWSTDQKANAIQATIDSNRFGDMYRISGNNATTHQLNELHQWLCMLQTKAPLWTWQAAELSAGE